MPATYRYRAPSLSNESLESSSSTDPVITDADDSIVLSDLVRTGEASRLRRRGAMRLEHGHGNHVGGSAIIPSPPAIAVAQPTWDDPIRVLGTEGEIDEGRMTQFTREARRSDADGDTHHVFGYTLFCGGETSSLEMDTGDTSPFEPSPLPAFPPLPGSSSDTSTRRSSRRSRVTNGCGALLHTHAGPRKRLGVWTAKSAATDVVIGMDSCYFDRAAVAKIVRSSCGCVREGVGCAVWYASLLVPRTLPLTEPIALVEIRSEHDTNLALSQQTVCLTLPQRLHPHHDRIAALCTHPVRDIGANHLAQLPSRPPSAGRPPFVTRLPPGSRLTMSTLSSRTPSPLRHRILSLRLAVSRHQRALRPPPPPL
jgi:hypothetical protein